MVANRTWVRYVRVIGVVWFFPHLVAGYERLACDYNLTRVEITTVLGSPVNLGCYVTKNDTSENTQATSTITYVWLKDNKSVPQTPNSRIHENVLVVTPRNDTDFGIYECNATNGVSSTRCRIEVKRGWNKTERLACDYNLTRVEITTVLGSPVNLGCYVTKNDTGENTQATSTITYVWLKDNKSVPQTPNSRIHENVLVVTPRNDTDFGIYECNATNGVSSTRCRIEVKRGWNKTERLACDYNLTRVEITTVLGSPVNLGCYVTKNDTGENTQATSTITYVWLKDNKSVPQTPNSRIHENVLVVTPRNDTDFGIYECNATNGVSSTRCRIEVKRGWNKTERLACDYNLTRVEITTVLGSPVNLGCYVTKNDTGENTQATSTITYVWLKDNKSVPQTPNSRIHENVLVVTPRNDTDFGIYECNATNGVSSTRCRIEVKRGWNKTAYEDIPPGNAGCANLSMLIPVFTITILSLLYNVHFFIRRKREDRWMLSEEEIMQLRAAREPVAFEERSEETVEVKKKKRLFGRLRKRCKGKNENNHRIDENETNHQESVCNSSTRGRHKEESIELKEIQGIPSVADSKTTKKNDDTEHAPTDEDRRPAVSEPPRISNFFQTTGDENDLMAPARSNATQRPAKVDTFRIPNFVKVNVERKDDSASESPSTFQWPAVAEPPRNADFFTTTDGETDDTVNAPPDTPCSSTVAEPPRIVNFFVLYDETDGESSGCESADSEHPLVSHYMERMDFQGKDDSEDEPFLK